MTHKPLITIILLFLWSSRIYAQNAPDAYWQQEVNYKINVTLNDKTNELTGNIEIEYINHSPDDLSFIWMHLWPNAYKDVTTAFAKQEVENGSTEFLFSKPEDRGYIDKLDFNVNGENVQFTLDPNNIDIGKITLNEPLKSGGKITITTPFHVKLPYTFSRGGHVGQSYQISQWYPKPAVYDMKGWHPIPYLDQGEFYSEFGSYDVQITLPGNYVVGATGDLQNESELKWLNEKSAFAKKMFGLQMTDEEKALAAHYDSTKVDSSMKTLHYVQHNIHDFAWFADKKYYVLKSEVKLPNSGNIVTTWLMFAPKRDYLWKNATTYIDSAVYYYSKWLGDYPYKQVTAVTGALQAGGGMEYPNVTVIGDMSSAQDLEVDIAHEIGHNWLYGVLGFNERDYPWMDEGINSYYEERYMETRQPGERLLNLNPQSGLTKFFGLKHFTYRYGKYFNYVFQQRRHEDQAIDLPATEYSPLNYASIIYSKTPLILIHLAAYLGQQKFDNIMQHFYEDWKYKHPQPEDFQHEFVSRTNVNLDWFFNQAMATTLPLDYKVTHDRDTMHIANSVYQKIGIKNTGAVKAPYAISAIKNDTVVLTKWYGGFNGRMDVLFPAGDYDAFRIDANEDLWESNRKNDIIRTHGLFRKTEPLRLQLLGSAENPERTQLFFSPAVGWNNYNGFMGGLAFYNSLAPVKNVEYELVPLYAFGSNTFEGIGRTAFHYYPADSIFHEIVFTLTGSRFGYGMLNYEDIHYLEQFDRVCGRFDFNFRKRARSTVDDGLTLRTIFIQTPEDFYLYQNLNAAPMLNVSQMKNLYAILTFHVQNKRVINPYSLALNFEDGFLGGMVNGFYSRLYLEGNYRVNYNSKNSGLSLRLFAGTTLAEGEGVSMNYNLGATTGSQDYLYDEAYLGRSETQGILSQQFIMTQGGLKYRNDLLLTPIGSSTSIVSLNLKSSLPLNTPVFLFFDFGAYYINSSSGLSGIYKPYEYDGGVGITIIPKVCEVYVPFIFSKDIQQNINTIPQYSKWYNRILFTLNISQLNPFDKIRHFEN